MIEFQTFFLCNLLFLNLIFNLLFWLEIKYSLELLLLTCFYNIPTILKTEKTFLIWKTTITFLFLTVKLTFTSTRRN